MACCAETVNLLATVRRVCGRIRLLLLNPESLRIWIVRTTELPTECRRHDHRRWLDGAAPREARSRLVGTEETRAGRSFADDRDWRR